MKRNFDTTFKQLNGDDLKDGGAATAGVDAVLSLKVVSVNSLLAPFEVDKNLSGEEKLRRYLLATKIHAGGEVDLTAEDISLLKLLIGRGYSALIVGQAFLMLESDASSADRHAVGNVTVHAHNVDTAIGVKIG